MGGFMTALDSCKDALESIQEFSTDLENSIKKAKRGLRQWAAVKVSFQERKLKGYLSRLERAKSMLSLAHQVCMQSQIMHMAPQQQQSPWKPPEGWAVIMDQSQAHALHSGSKNAIANELSFQPLINGILRSGFSLLRERSLGAWQYSLRTFSTFTTGDAICQFCVSGDLLGAKRLCSRGIASPYDVTHGGFTLLHIAATYGRADMCQWLLELGVDAGTTASSRATADDGARLMLFDAGAGVRFDVKSGAHWVPDAVQYMDRISQQRPRDYLDTVRVLVENGADPMAVDVNGDTPLHLDTGAIEQFHYLLQQECFVTECSQLNFGGDTIAERHARFFWDSGPQRASLAWEHENTRKRGFHSYGLERPPPFPVTSKVLLLHETASHLRYFATRNRRDYDSALALVRKLIGDGVDIHSRSGEDPDYNKTPLAQIPRLTGEGDTGPKGLDRESLIIHLIFKSWLGILREGNVDLGHYIREEEKLIQSEGIDRRWQLYEDDPEWEYGVVWAFQHNTEGGSPAISAQYVFRQILQESRELEEVPEPEPEPETDFGDVPGAWIENMR
ncbi:MAG: hypothetical protein Q9208_004557 [Pyrenodesmia sp. 3 TL-2023]